MEHIHTMVSNKKEGITDWCNTVDELKMHFAKTKPHSKGYKLYALLFAAVLFTIAKI